MAPEVLREDNYNEKADVYSFGVIVFFILSNGQMPDIKLGELMNGIIPEIPSSFEILSAQLIESCWSSDPEERPSFDLICDKLEENEFELFNLSETEKHEIQFFVNKLKEKIPSYSSK